MKFYQQGDVILIPVNSIPKECKKDETNTNVLQEGESTGHAHRVHGEDFSIFNMPNSNKKYLRLVQDAPLRHEEHNEIHLPKGDYEIRIVREYDHFKEEARAVAD